MKSAKLITGCALLLCHAGSGQWSDTSRTHDVQEKAKFIFNFDIRRQEVRGDIVRFFGVRAGVQKRYNIYALGLYGLGTPFEQRNIRLADIGLDSAEIRSTLNYVSGTYERILLDTRHWQMSVPFMVGIGNAPVDYKDSTGTYQRYKDIRVVPLEAGLRTSFKMLFWLYLQGGIGYRRVTGPNAIVNDEYSGPTWNFGLSIKFGKIYKYARQKLEERRERNDDDHGSP